MLQSVNKLFSSVPSIESQHDVSYKAKFIAALRLWRKREEEKGVWEILFCIVISLWNLRCCEELMLVQRNLQ